MSLSCNKGEEISKSKNSKITNNCFFIWMSDNRKKILNEINSCATHSDFVDTLKKYINDESVLDSILTPIWRTSIVYVNNTVLSTVLGHIWKYLDKEIKDEYYKKSLVYNKETYYQINKNHERQMRKERRKNNKILNLRIKKKISSKIRHRDRDDEYYVQRMIEHERYMKHLKTIKESLQDLTSKLQKYGANEYHHVGTSDNIVSNQSLEVKPIESKPIDHKNNMINDLNSELSNKYFYTNIDIFVNPNESIDPVFEYNYF